MAEEGSLVKVGILAGVGFLAYQYWWKPMQLQDEYNRQLALYMAQHPGLSRNDAIAQIGGWACQAAGAYYKIPPQLSGGVCKVAGIATSALVHAIPDIAKLTYSGGKAIVSDVYGGGKTVVKDVVSVPVKVVSSVVGGVRSGISAVGHFFGA